MGTEIHRKILLADADAFFVSVARLVDPEGAGRKKLLIVGGSPDGRGVVTSASYEAREYGVRSAMPTGRALKLCPGATVVGVPRRECVARSKAVRKVLEDFSPAVEQASIDEFYVDMTGTEGLYREPLETTAARMRKLIKERTGVPFSIGGGSSKLIAKLAAQQAKPHRGASGVHIVAVGGEIDFMSTHRLAEIPLVGPRLAEKLASLGLRTVPEALALEAETLVTMLGERSGRWLYRRIRGLDGGKVHPGRPNKSVSHERTFARDLKSEAEVQREILSLATRVAADVRRKKMKSRTVTVKIRYSDFTTKSAAKTFAAPVSADRPVHDAAVELLAKLRRSNRRPVRLLGVALSHLQPASAEWRQLGLFAESEEGLETDHDVILSGAVDRIRDKFGSHGIVRGTEVREERTRTDLDGLGRTTDR